MKISWIIADSFKDPNIDPESLAEIGSTWGSWQTWRAWSTDNVLCYDSVKAKDLVSRAFQAVCNLYLPQKSFVSLGRPSGVKLFDGEFPEEFDHIEEIIAMHLVADHNDLVLLLGFDLADSDIDNTYQKHKRQNYLSAFAGAVKMYPDTQWVILDHSESLSKHINGLENISCDSYKNVLDLLGN